MLKFMIRNVIRGSHGLLSNYVKADLFTLFTSSAYNANSIYCSKQIDLREGFLVPYFQRQIKNDF